MIPFLVAVVFAGWWGSPWLERAVARADLALVKEAWHSVVSGGENAGTASTRCQYVASNETGPLVEADIEKGARVNGPEAGVSESPVKPGSAQGSGNRQAHPIAGMIRAFTVSGNRAFVGWFDMGPTLDEGGLGIVDLSDPQSPQLVWSWHGKAIADGVAVSGGLMYVAWTVRSWEREPYIGPRGLEDEGKLEILRVEDMSNPVPVGKLESLGVRNSRSTCIAVHNGVAYVGTAGGLALVDVRDPASPKLAGTYETPWYVFDIVVADNKAYVSAAGLYILDVSEPSRPHLLASYRASPGGGRETYDVVLIDRVAYVTCMWYLLTSRVAWNKVATLDITIPSSPRQLATFATGRYVFKLAALDHILYVANDEDLQAYDVNNPSNPRWVSTFTLRRLKFIDDLAVEGDRLYVAGSSGIYILDVTNPCWPRVVGQYLFK